MARTRRLETLGRERVSVTVARTSQGRTNPQTRHDSIRSTTRPVFVARTTPTIASVAPTTALVSAAVVRQLRGTYNSPSLIARATYDGPADEPRRRETHVTVRARTHAHDLRAHRDAHDLRGARSVLAHDYACELSREHAFSQGRAQCIQPSIHRQTYRFAISQK